jgi:flagellar hook-associated protein FlgK
MTDLLSIGASGVRGYQTALGTVSENIANSGAPGYVRRTTDLKEVIAPGGGLQTGRVVGGMGVVVAGVSRQVDAYKVAAARTAGADLAKTTAGVAWLEQVETALSGDQLGARMTGFFTAARTLAADPSSTAARATMLEAATAAAHAFAATGRRLDRVGDDLDASAKQAAADLDGLGEALAKVNERIGRAQAGSSAAASLADERDRLIDRMSEIVDVDVTEDAAGRATVRLGGRDGPVFVAGAEAGNVIYARGETGAVAFAIMRRGESAALTPGGGTLGGIADAAGRLTDARVRLDALASAFADSVNAVQRQGRDLDGQPGRNLFADVDRAVDLKVSLTDPRGIAAAGVGGGPRDASNLEALERARTAGRFEGAFADLVGGNAAALQQRRTVAEAQSAIREGAVAARDAVGGVDLDQEAVQLMRFQQAYQASSRVIQVARDTFQTILEIR